MLSDFPNDMKGHIMTLLPLLVGSNTFTEGRGGETPQYFQNCQKIGQKSAMLKERPFSAFLATVVGQMVNTPPPHPNGNCHGTSLLVGAVLLMK